MPLSNYNSEKRSDKNLYNYVRAAGDRLSLFSGTEASFVFCFLIIFIFLFRWPIKSRSAWNEAQRQIVTILTSDSLELSLIKSEISQSEECLRSWELGPADNLPGI